MRQPARPESGAARLGRFAKVIFKSFDGILNTGLIDIQMGDQSDRVFVCCDQYPASAHEFGQVLKV